MTSTDRGKSRLSFSKLMGKKDNPYQHGAQPSNTSNVADSAYASSENEPKASTSDYNVPMKNDGSIPGVSQDQNLSLNQRTGDVTDNATGEVVTTVTTTTTTTTTTTRTGKNGEKETVVSTGAPQIQEMPADAPSNTMLNPNSITTASSEASHTPPTAPEFAPLVPSRSPNRRSQEHYRPSTEMVENPVSPVDGNNSRHNFSYPSRNNLKDGPDTTPERQRGSGTIESLKAAAIGLHGVGETLRGTLNNGIDTRYSRRDPDKAAAINAKNQATLEAGQREMAGLRERQGLNSTVNPESQKDLQYLPQQPLYTYHTNGPENSTALPVTPSDSDRGTRPHGTAVDPEPEQEAEYGSHSDYAKSYDTGESYGYQQTPPTTATPSAADKIEKRMRKLMKRR